MDAFEQLVSEVLWSEGCWTQTEVKVELTKEEKRLIGRPSAPRWELDVVGYAPQTNALRIIECKSYLDSAGVVARDLMDPDSKGANRYKLFTDETLRTVVIHRLALQFTEMGACAPNPKITLGLACGHFRSTADQDALKLHFDERGWELLDEAWIVSHLKTLANGGYTNKTSAVVAKLIYRKMKGVIS
ncbi:hypothetical protein ACQKKX_03095 [Neorhizobium sp. NPDC001467]|uniref:hypothetical protein n=1 Tax=Neorhizobium sp. NPDC001467 TaxID=3390595 RepID=UPI003CFC98B6